MFNLIVNYFNKRHIISIDFYDVQCLGHHYYEIDFHRALNEIIEKKINCKVFNVENLKDFDKAFDEYRRVKPKVLVKLFTEFRCTL